MQSHLNAIPPLRNPTSTQSHLYAIPPLHNPTSTQTHIYAIPCKHHKLISQGKNNLDKRQRKMIHPYLKRQKHQGMWTSPSSGTSFVGGGEKDPSSTQSHLYAIPPLRNPTSTLSHLYAIPPVRNPTSMLSHLYVFSPFAKSHDVIQPIRG